MLLSFESSCPVKKNGNLYIYFKPGSFVQVCRRFIVYEKPCKQSAIGNQKVDEVKSKGQGKEFLPREKYKFEYHLTSVY